MPKQYTPRFRLPPNGRGGGGGGVEFSPTPRNFIGASHLLEIIAPLREFKGTTRETSVKYLRREFKNLLLDGYLKIVSSCYRSVILARCNTILLMAQ